MTWEITLKAIIKAPNHQGRNKVPTGHQLQEAEEVEASVEDSAPNQKGCFVYYVGKIRGIQQGHAKSLFRSIKK
jgi:molybdopterin synthase catalytic subunit